MLKLNFITTFRILYLTKSVGQVKSVLPPLSVGEMTLRFYGALSYRQNSARHLSLRAK